MSLAEKRTQIYLPLGLFRTLRQEARAEKKSIAQLIREAITAHLEGRRMKRLDWEHDPLQKIIGAGEAGTDLATHHDKYLYGRR